MVPVLLSTFCEVQGAGRCLTAICHHWHPLHGVKTRQGHNYGATEHRWWGSISDWVGGVLQTFGAPLLQHDVHGCLGSAGLLLLQLAAVCRLLLIWHAKAQSGAAAEHNVCLSNAHP